MILGQWREEDETVLARRWKGRNWKTGDGRTRLMVASALSIRVGDVTSRHSERSRVHCQTAEKLAEGMLRRTLHVHGCSKIIQKDWILEKLNMMNFWVHSGTTFLDSVAGSSFNSCISVPLPSSILYIEWVKFDPSVFVKRKVCVQQKMHRRGVEPLPIL
jgi:hypothetical protein